MARIVGTGSRRVSSSSLTTAFARSNAWTTYRDLSSLKCGVAQKMSPVELLQLRVSRNASPLSYIANSAIEPSQDEESDAHDHYVRRLRDLVDNAGGKVVALTGAGVSTDSGIPDYRGPQGSYSWGYKPMTHDEFLSSEGNQKRYWFRSMFGWTSFAKARPNAAHFALADLEAAGKVNGLITQNVDGLHQKAGSRNVIDMHGRNDRVKCMCCGQESDRNAYQVHLARINSSLIAELAPKAGRSGERLRADGDADVDAGEKLRDFIVSPCSYCGGVLKPTVVFFGDNIPRPRVEETYRMVDASDVLIAAGSSLQVYSAFRLVKRAADAGKKIVVVNLGDTRAERSGLDLLKVEAGVSAVLPQLL